MGLEASPKSCLGLWFCSRVPGHPLERPTFGSAVSCRLPIRECRSSPALFRSQIFQARPACHPSCRVKLLLKSEPLNLKRLASTGDPEIATRIASYEMAYRMQTSGPELADFSKETPATLQLYGAEPGAKSFANNCLLARRLVERGVRFVQLCHSNWDSHGGRGETLTEDFDRLCLETDRGCAALVRDLKERGLLDETLVIWGGEFGRAPMGEFKEASVGRNHHIEAFTMWFAGGGVKPGQTIGQTDEIGFSPVAGRVDIHDVHATILHLFGLDHERLTFRFQGRDFRLTDVAGNVIQKLFV